MSNVAKFGTGIVSGAIIAGLPGLITAAAITTCVVAGQGIVAVVSGKKSEPLQVENSETDNAND